MRASWGGTQLTLPPVGTGSAYVTGTSEGFTVSPEAALAQYITMLNSGTQDTTQFVADDFTKTYLSNVTDLNSSVSAAGSVTARPRRRTTRFPAWFSRMVRLWLRPISSSR